MNSQSNSIFQSNEKGQARADTVSNPVIYAVFPDKESTEEAYNLILSRGYILDDINLMMIDETRDKYFAENDDNSALGSKAMEGLGTGSAIGGTLGAIIGGIAAIGTNVLLPGLGLVVAGPLAAALAGAGAGGLTGGLVGALVSSGIPEDRAREYEESIRQGGIIMGINLRSQEDADYLSNEFSRILSYRNPGGTGIRNPIRKKGIR
jgi:hypothetical protein